MAGACSSSEPTATPTPTPQPGDYDPQHLMWAGTISYLFSDFRFIYEMEVSRDPTFVPVLLDLWLSRATLAPEQFGTIDDALTLLTDGEGADSLNEFYQWLSERPEVVGPPGYADWKSVMFGLVDPNIGAFLHDGVKHGIRLEEVVWGGVRRDGIPDLRFPPSIPAAEADYLNDTDRVFGLSHQRRAPRLPAPHHEPP